MFAAKLHIGVAIDEKRWEDVMRNHHAIVLSLLCGVGIGAAGVEGLRAQAKPPIYMIGNNDVNDPDGSDGQNAGNDESDPLPVARRQAT